MKNRVGLEPSITAVILSDVPKTQSRLDWELGMTYYMLS